MADTIRRGAAHHGRTGALLALSLLIVILAVSLLEPGWAHGADDGSNSAFAGDDPNATAAATATPVTVQYGKDARQYYLAWIPPQPTTRTAVVVVHGGYWIGGSPTSVSGLNKKLYADGIPSFSVGYRLAEEAKWPAQRTDVLAAMSDIKSKADSYAISPRRVALIGSSAGGHIALAIASTEGAKATCAAISYSAPTSIDLAQSDAGGDARRDRLATAAQRLAPTVKQKKTANLPVSPSSSDAPALLFAGQREWLPYVNSSLYVNAYKGTGLAVQPVILSAVSEHAQAYALNMPLVWRMTTKFLDEHC
ncbi:alpha/beta hydrolase [Spongisporangium articulatum]|uniref:Alpha/beta hydrolase n=1 Tax=Spongisporangium articulatum TaxID=3362603 RepID=A0ABW8AHR4_9ACTN